MVDALGHGTPVDQGVAAGGAAGDDLQPAADPCLHGPGNVHQLLHILRRRLHRAVAAQVYPHTGQVQVVKPLLHMAADLHHLRLIPKAFPQVPQISHNDHPMGDALLGADAVQRIQGGGIALQGVVRQPSHFRQLRKPRHPQQHIRPRDTFPAPQLHLLQAAGGKLRCAAAAIQPGNLRQSACPLYHTGHGYAPGLTVLDDLGAVVAQLVPVYYNAGKFSIHDPTSIFHR